MKWSHNDQWMLTSDHGGFVKYWQSNMNNVQMYQAHKDPVRGLRYDQPPQDVSLFLISNLVQSLLVYGCIFVEMIDKYCVFDSFCTFVLLRILQKILMLTVYTVYEKDVLHSTLVRPLIKKPPLHLCHTIKLGICNRLVIEDPPWTNHDHSPRRIKWRIVSGAKHGSLFQIVRR